MITVMKSHGATSTAKGKQHEGSKGRLELFACRVRDGDEEGFELRFLDYGNYGRQRWEANFGFLDDYDIRGMIDSLHALLHDKIETTHISHEQTTDEATSNEDNNTTENFPETSANAVEVNNERVSEQSL